MIRRSAGRGPSRSDHRGELWHRCGDTDGGTRSPESPRPPAPVLYATRNLPPEQASAMRRRTSFPTFISYPDRWRGWRRREMKRHPSMTDLQSDHLLAVVLQLLLVMNTQPCRLWHRGPSIPGAA